MRLRLARRAGLPRPVVAFMFEAAELFDFNVYFKVFMIKIGKHKNKT